MGWRLNCVLGVFEVRFRQNRLFNLPQSVWIVDTWILCLAFFKLPFTGITNFGLCSQVQSLKVWGILNLTCKEAFFDRIQLSDCGSWISVDLITALTMLNSYVYATVIKITSVQGVQRTPELDGMLIKRCSICIT